VKKARKEEDEGATAKERGGRELFVASQSSGRKLCPALPGNN